MPSSFFDYLKRGNDYTTKTGELIRNEWVTDPAVKPKSYAYSADTLYDEELVDKVKRVDMLYHETTYLKDLEARAFSRFHATTIQAAAIAKMADVGRLLIGHFSSKYEKLDIFEQEAREIFQNTDLAVEGVTYNA